MGTKNTKNAEVIQITPHMRILVAIELVDFRKRVDGLAGVCWRVLKEDPFSGACFVFRTCTGTAVKCFYPAVIAPLACPATFPATPCFATIFPAAEVQQDHLRSVCVCNLFVTPRLSD